MISIGAPTVAAVEKLALYGFTIEASTTPAYGMNDRVGVVCQNLISVRGQTNVQYFAEPDRYGYTLRTLTALVEEFPQNFMKPYKREGTGVDFEINRLIRQFDRLLTSINPGGSGDPRGLAEAFSLYTDSRNRRFASNIGLRYASRSHRTLADCYRLTQEALTTGQWDRIMSVWERRLPVDILIEVARGANIHLMLAFELPEPKASIFVD